MDRLLCLSVVKGVVVAVLGEEGYEISYTRYVVVSFYRETNYAYSMFSNSYASLSYVVLH